MIILTIGHSTRTIEEFIGLLLAHGVRQVADVRTIPRSRHNPQFNADSLPQSLKNAGVGYVHMAGLGGLRHPARDSLNVGWCNGSFRGFADYMQTPEFEKALDELIQLATKERVALMCAEAVPWRCHRSLIADALVVRGIHVEHIMGPTRRQVHNFTRFAKVRGSRITYPAENSPTPVPPFRLDLTAWALRRRPSNSTATRLYELSTAVPVDDLQRIEDAIDHVAQTLDVDWLISQSQKELEFRLSPAAFLHQLTERARAAKKRIVLPEGVEPRTVKAAAICARRGIARCVLLGDPDEVQAVARSQDIALPDDLEVLNPMEVRPKYVNPLFELRKNKGLSMEMAASQLEDNVVLGTMMLSLGEVDGLVSGAVHSTANTIRPALQIIKTKPNAKAVSSIFFMCLPEQVLVYGDCAVIPDPDAQTLADIALQSADSAAAFGIPPRVAMISYSTGESGSGVDVVKVREATKLAQKIRPDILIDGPLQYDAAFMPDVAKTKAPNSPVAGRATVFIFPDLNTGNTTYKAVQRSANVISIGPMLQGLKRPVNDLSRGALVDDIVYTIALTVVQATQG